MTSYWRMRIPKITWGRHTRLSGELELVGFKSVCIVVSINNISLLKTDSDREKYDL